MPICIMLFTAAARAAATRGFCAPKTGVCGGAPNESPPLRPGVLVPGVGVGVDVGVGVGADESATGGLVFLHAGSVTRPTTSASATAAAGRVRGTGIGGS